MRILSFDWNDFTKQGVPQGYEDEIFKGLEDLLDRYSIDHISVEILPRRDLDFKLQFLAKLMQKGYHVYTYHDFHTTELFIKNKYEAIIANAPSKFGLTDIFP